MKINFFVALVFLSLPALGGESFALKGKLISYSDKDLVLEQENKRKVRLTFQEANLPNNHELRDLIGKKIDLTVDQATLEKAMKVK